MEATWPPVAPVLVLSLHTTDPDGVDSWMTHLGSTIRSKHSPIDGISWCLLSHDASGCSGTTRLSLYFLIPVLLIIYLFTVFIHSLFISLILFFPSDAFPSSLICINWPLKGSNTYADLFITSFVIFF